jgi:hypothetical protein
MHTISSKDDKKDLARALGICLREAKHWRSQTRGEVNTYKEQSKSQQRPVGCRDEAGDGQAEVVHTITLMF